MKCDTCHQRSATIAITHTIIWSMLFSSSSSTVLSIHSFTRLCCAPRRQTSPGCKERPIYLSGRRRAELRRHPNGEKNPTPYIFHVLLWSHCLTMSIVYFGWVWPSRPRAQRKPVPWVCKAHPPRPRAVVVISEIGLCQDPPRIDRTTPFLSGPCGFRPGACV